MSTSAGAFRECFSKRILLGAARNPINVTEECHMERTQDDPSSTIRACLCTKDLCNHGGVAEPKAISGKDAMRPDDQNETNTRTNDSIYLYYIRSHSLPQNLSADSHLIMTKSSQGGTAFPFLTIRVKL